MMNELVMDVGVGLVVPPFLTGLWLIFVYLNNRFSLRQIAPHPWRHLIQLYLVVVVLTAFDLSGR
jgi:hypothetical protein